MPGVWPAAKSEALMIVGSSLAQKKQYDDARNQLKKCIALEGGEAWHKCDAQMTIAKTYLEEGKKQEAKNEFETLLKMNGLNDTLRKQAESQLQNLK